MTVYKKLDIPALFIAKYREVREFDRDLMASLESWESNIEAILANGITISDNVNSKIVSFTSNVAPDTEDTIAHGLGKVPIGFNVINKDKAADTYDSGTSWTATNLYLKTSVASATIKLEIF